ncbi:MAG: hypothetical protein WB297_15890 [Actinomycetota bacterium]
MKTAIKVALATLMGCGALLLALGLVIWIGHSEQLIAVHIAIGIALVLTLWTICAIAARSGVPAGAVAFAAAWGLLIVVLGLAQEDLLPGSWHWTIQVLHLVVSMGAMWWGRRLVRLIGQAQRSVDAPRPVTGSPVTTSGTGST